MNRTDTEYFRLLNLIQLHGRKKSNRTGVPTIGVFGAQARFDLSEGFPILTTKKVFFKGIVHELLWFISGSTNIKYLVDNNVHIWDEWAYKRYVDWWNKTDFEEKRKATNPQPHTQEEFINLIKENPFFVLNGENTGKTWSEYFGDLGEGTYGSMWRAFPYFDYVPSEAGKTPHGYVQTCTGKDQYKDLVLRGVDQLKKVVEKLKTNPDDRRLIVSAWHPHWVDHCALPPCHCLFHFNTEELTLDERMDILYTTIYKKNVPTPAQQSGIAQFIESECERYQIPKRRLNLLLYQRSCDTFLGVPFNISSYSLLLAMVAHCVNMEAGTFVHTYGDLHIYENHIEQIKLQMTRTPYDLPKLQLNPAIRDLFAFTYEDIKLVDYQSHPAIKGEVAV